METKTLITSYDEINDTFVGKIDGKTGIFADYGISDGVFLGIDKNNLPNSVYVNNASEVFDISKEILENSNVVIYIDCDNMCINFHMFIEGLKICSIKCRNEFGIAEISYEIDSNH